MASTVPPKPPGQRVRRNKDQPQWQTLDPDGPGLKAPPLPDRFDGEDWSDLTQKRWKALWASPMAINYLDADLPALERMADYWQRVEEGRATAAQTSAVTQLEDRFGLSPKGRRQLQWEIKKGEAEISHRRASSKRRRLRAVATSDAAA